MFDSVTTRGFLIHYSSICLSGPGHRRSHLSTDAHISCLLRDQVLLEVPRGVPKLAGGNNLSTVLWGLLPFLCPWKTQKVSWSDSRTTSADFFRCVGWMTLHLLTHRHPSDITFHLFPALSTDLNVSNIIVHRHSCLTSDCPSPPSSWRNYFSYQHGVAHPWLSL